MIVKDLLAQLNTALEKNLINGDDEIIIFTHDGVKYIKGSLLQSIMLPKVRVKPQATFNYSIIGFIEDVTK
jgi:hypothetical protein